MPKQFMYGVCSGSVRWVCSGSVRWECRGDNSCEEETETGGGYSLVLQSPISSENLLELGSRTPAL